MTLSGAMANRGYTEEELVLIPLLVDDPLWVFKLWTIKILWVLIPLLVDDPLWGVFYFGLA